MISRIGPTELILILALALIIFGPKKLPEIGRALGNAIREFRNTSSQVQKDLDVTEISQKEESSEDDSTSLPKS